MCLVIIMLGPISGGSVWAGGGHHGGGGHHHGGHHHGWGGFYPGYGYGFGGYGLGLGMGYGLGYYGGYGYGGYGGYGFGMPYYPPYYAYPPVVAVPSAPPVYIQQQPQGAVQPAPQAPVNYWHYCRNPEGYYPYVKKCPDGWLQVVPQSQPNN